MKAKVNKNRAYREKQRKAASIKAGIKFSDEPTGKYAKNIPDSAIEDIMRQGYTREEAVQLARRMLKVRTINVQYGDDVCCHLCGRKNYPASIDGKELQWTPSRSLFLVEQSLTELPRPHNSMILCKDCLDEMIEEKYHANGTFAICNEGVCTAPMSEFAIATSLNMENLERVFSWLMRKYERDSEYYSIKTGMEVAQWLRNLWKSHLLYAGGFMCHDKCYGMMCEHLGIPFNAEEYAIAAELQIKDFTPMIEGTHTINIRKD
jgi:hypothetical protein